LTAHPRISDSPAGRVASTVRLQRGTSFAELMLAVLIISTTVVASHSSLTGTVNAYHYFADGAHESLLLAKEIHEAALLLPWHEDPESTASFGSDVHTLFDLDGKDYSPPRSASYDIVTSHLDWSQHVEVRTVSMADPNQQVDPVSFSGQTLTELTVEVKDGEKLVGSYSWWLTEPTSE